MKDLIFMASSHDDLLEFPEIVRREVGFALFVAQQGNKALNVVPLVGFNGAGVLEVVSSFDGDAYRSVYTVTIGNIVYVLHAFKKKSKSGRSTPRADIALIRRRLKAAQDDYQERTKIDERKSAS